MSLSHSFQHLHTLISLEYYCGILITFDIVTAVCYNFYHNHAVPSLNILVIMLLINILI